MHESKHLIYRPRPGSLDGVKDTSLALGSISGLYLLSGALHGAYDLSCDFIGPVKFTLKSKLIS